MKIIALKSENIKNLKVVEIKPTGEAVILEGKNGAGKSAVLDSIFMALTGKKIDEPIRNGEARAEINVDLGEYKVRKIFTAKGERLEVVSNTGAKFTSPQTMLDKILGQLSFDPLAFSAMREKEQRQLLAGMVGLDFTELDKQREQAYNARTIKNREIKGGDPTQYRPSPNAPLPLESLVGNMEKPEEGLPRTEIDLVEEMKKVQELEDRARRYEEVVRENERYRLECQEVNRKTEQQKLEKLREIKLAEAELQRLKDELGELEAIIPVEPAVNPLPPAVSETDIAQARTRLFEAEDKNKRIRSAIEYDRKVADLEAARKIVADLETTMMKIDLEKQDRVNKAVFPIAGLGITDEYVTYQDKPFRQLSTGEQVRISTAIAMALNPTLKVLLVREGSLLDNAGLQAIVELAKSQDYQVWIERVADGPDGCGIYLEEGEIKQ